jgi:hypothetical protein
MYCMPSPLSTHRVSARAAELWLATMMLPLLGTVCAKTTAAGKTHCLL